MRRGGGAHVSGRTWELAAAEFLEQRGCTVIERGYRCRLGELDILCLHGDTLVVVEVRARATSACGSAVESVDMRKQKKIINATRHFLMRHPRWFDSRVRFDVVAVDGIETDEPRFSWVTGAFDAS